MSGDVFRAFVVTNADNGFERSPTMLPITDLPGDGSLITAERNFITDLQARALALKRQGVSADDAGKQLSVEFKTKYANWPNMNVAGFVQSVYAEAP